MQGDVDDYVIKIRGLPWSSTETDILNFFGGCRIVNGKAGIQMTLNHSGLPSGEAFIEMENLQDIEKALKKHKRNIGHRYIEVFKTTRSEMDSVMSRTAKNLENASDESCVRLRGLPFQCTKEEIIQFFSGLEIVPDGITMLTNQMGRSSGEAFVRFVSKEMAEKSLQRNREKIGQRYIEIFHGSNVLYRGNPREMLSSKNIASEG